MELEFGADTGTPQGAEWRVRAWPVGERKPTGVVKSERPLHADAHAVSRCVGITRIELALAFLPRQLTRKPSGSPGIGSGTASCPAVARRPCRSAGEASSALR